MRFIQDSSKKAILKKLLILFCVILAVFATINGVWYFGYQRRFESMAEHLEMDSFDLNESKTVVRYFREVDDHNIVLGMPTYLGSGGRVALEKAEGCIVEQDDAGNIVGGNGIHITLFIWPRYFSGYLIGVDFDDPLNDLWAQTELNSDLKPLYAEEMDPESIAFLTQLIEENRGEIETMIRIAEETLNIQIWND